MGRAWMAALVGLALTVPTAIGTPVAAQDTQVSCPTGVPAMNAHVASRFIIDVLDNRDTSGMADLFAEDAVYHTSSRGDIEGVDAIKAMYDDMISGGRSRVSDPAITVDAILANENHVAAAFTTTGIYDTAVDGTPASGEPVTYSRNIYAKMECGKIKDLWSLSDQFSRMGQYGQFAVSDVPEGLMQGADQLPTNARANECTVDDDNAVREALLSYYLDGFGDKNESRARLFLDENVLYHPVSGDDVIGPDAVMETFKRRITSMPDLKVTVNDFFAADGFGALRWTFTGTDTGGIYGNQPTNKTATWDGIMIVRLDCGKITEMWSESDNLGSLRQLGLVPEN